MTLSAFLFALFLSYIPSKYTDFCILLTPYRNSRSIPT